MIKSKIELRLIIKQARINASEDDPNQTVRVEFTRNGKSLSTSDKPVNEQTGEGDIKQSFNQKIQEQREAGKKGKWVPD